MKRSGFLQLFLLIRAAQPLQLLVGIITYSLGAGIVVYLGDNLNWTNFLLGQLVVLMLLLSSSWLNSYFDALDFPQFELPIRDSGKQDQKKNESVSAFPSRRLALQAALTTLAVGAVLTVLLFKQSVLRLPEFAVLGLAFGLAFFYSVPPLRLVYSGYGELVQAVLLVTLIPSFSYMLQSGELHRLLAILTFPLSMLYLAMLLAFSLRSYANDLKYQYIDGYRVRRKMMIRLGWRRGMILHNALITSAYLLLGASFLVGLPWRLTWPGLLTLPVGAFQIWQVIQIANGAPTRWRVLLLSAVTTFTLTSYFITISLWTG